MKHLILNLFRLVNKFPERLTRTHFNRVLSVEDSQLNSCFSIIIIEIKELVLWEGIFGCLYQIPILNCWMSSDKLTDI